MTPPAIVAAAREKGLAMIAICDHNSAGNVAAVQAAAGRGLAVIAGIEITTAEEVHVLGLFPGAWAARAAGEAVRATLPDATAAAAARFGPARVLDAAGRLVGHDGKLLSGASALDLNAAIALIHQRNGLAIAAHVDRPAFSVLGQLGGIPREARFDGIEVSAAGVAAGRGARLAGLGLPLVCGSDGHSLGEVGAGRTLLDAREPSFGELSLALRGLGGRGCVCA